MLIPFQAILQMNVPSLLFQQLVVLMQFDGQEEYSGYNGKPGHDGKPPSDFFFAVNLGQALRFSGMLRRPFVSRV